MVEQGRTTILFLSGLTPRCAQIFPHRCCLQPVRRFRQQCLTLFGTVAGCETVRAMTRTTARATIPVPKMGQFDRGRCPMPSAAPASICPPETGRIGSLTAYPYLQQVNV